MLTLLTIYACRMGPFISLRFIFHCELALQSKVFVFSLCLFMLFSCCVLNAIAYNFVRVFFAFVLCAHFRIDLLTKMDCIISNLATIHNCISGELFSIIFSPGVSKRLLSVWLVFVIYEDLPSVPFHPQHCYC